MRSKKPGRRKLAGEREVFGVEGEGTSRQVPDNNRDRRDESRRAGEQERGWDSTKVTGYW